MAAGSAKIHRVNFHAVATFGTTAPVAGSAWTHLPAIGRPRPKLIQERDSASEANARGNMSVDYATRKKFECDYESRIYTGTKGFDGSSGDSDPTSCYLQALLESHFGGVANNDEAGSSAHFVGTTIAAGTVTAPELTSVTNLRVGDIIAFGSTFQVRVVKAISGSTVTLDRAISAADAGIVVYAAFNFRFYKASHAGALAKYVYMNHELDGHKWLGGPGRVTGLTFDGMSGGAGLRAKMAFEGNTWATGVTPDSFTDRSTTFTGAPLVGTSGVVAINDTEVSVGGMSLTTGIQNTWSEGPTGTEGRFAIEPVAQENPTLSLTKLYEATDWTSFTARTGQEVLIAIPTGSTAAAKARGCFAAYMPNAQWDTEEGEENDQLRSVVKLVGKDPSAADVANGLDRCLYVAFFGGI